MFETTNDEMKDTDGGPAYTCDQCGLPIHNVGKVHQGELYCNACADEPRTEDITF